MRWIRGASLAVALLLVVLNPVASWTPDLPATIPAPADDDCIDLPMPPQPVLDPGVPTALEAGAALLLVSFRCQPAPALLREWTDLGLAPQAFAHFPVVAVTAQAAQLDAIVDAPGVLAVHANEQADLYVLPTAVEGNLGGTGDAILRADRARALGFDGSGVAIAVVDTGIDSRHPGVLHAPLGPVVRNYWILMDEGADVAAGLDGPATVVVPDAVDSDPLDGHGTHVAGTAAGRATIPGAPAGRAPGADLVGVSVGDLIFIFWALHGFDWILDNQDEYNIRVVTNSWGSEGPFSPYHPINVATKAMDEAGLVVLFAAGNAGPESDTLNKYAQAPWVIGVGSVSMAGDVSDFSSRGDPAQGTGPDVVTPGHNVVAPRSKPASGLDLTLLTPAYDAGFIAAEHLPLYRVISGTSMATPQVAGVVALLLDAAPHLAPAEVRDILYDTARPVIGFDYTAAGHGLVDAEAAVKRALGLPVAADWAAPTVEDVEGDDRSYPFHGTLLGSSLEGHAFRHDFPVPVRLPAAGLSYTLHYRPLTPGPTSFQYTLIAPDGTIVDQGATGSSTLEAGTRTFVVDETVLAAHMPEGWSAGYWILRAKGVNGWMEFDADGTVAYPLGLPDVVHVPPPPPPPPEPLPLVPHDPIHIVGEEDFTAENGVVSGSGTEQDPYIISGWVIQPDATGAITMTGTTSHVVIENMEIRHGGNICVDLAAVQHVTIRDSLLFDCYWTVYVTGGSSDVRIEGNVFRENRYGVAMYGADGVVIRDNLFVDHEQWGVGGSQGLTASAARFPLTTNILVEGNRFEQGGVAMLTSGAVGFTLRDNEIGGDVEFGHGSTGHKVSGTTWLGGEPRLRYILGTVESPRPWPIGVVVDAGSDRFLAFGATVCFSNAQGQVLPPEIVEATTWDFGDGEAVTGELQPCHTYADTTRDYTATLTVESALATGEQHVYADSVLVHAAP